MSLYRETLWMENRTKRLHSNVTPCPGVLTNCKELEGQIGRLANVTRRFYRTERAACVQTDYPSRPSLVWPKKFWARQHWHIQLQTGWSCRPSMAQLTQLFVYFIVIVFQFLCVYAVRCVLCNRGIKQALCVVATGFDCLISKGVVHPSNVVYKHWYITQVHESWRTFQVTVSEQWLRSIYLPWKKRRRGENWS